MTFWKTLGSPTFSMPRSFTAGVAAMGVIDVTRKSTEDPVLCIRKLGDQWERVRGLRILSSVR